MAGTLKHRFVATHGTGKDRWNDSLVAAGGANGQVMARDSSEADGWKWKHGSSAYYDVRDYGAVGDGVTDDTAAIQAAITACGTAGGGTVFFLYAIYLVSYAGGRTVNTITHRYCLLVPDHVHIDLDGSTIKQAASSSSHIFLNATAGTTQNHDLWIQNGTIDCDSSNQSIQTAEQAGIAWYDVLRGRVENVTVLNAFEYFGRFMTATECVFRNLRGIDSSAAGWSFGTPATSQEARDCYLDEIYAEACTGVIRFPTISGNGIIGSFIRCQIGSLTQVNGQGGIKIQDNTVDTSIASVYIEGGALGSANSGLKIMGGSPPADPPTRVYVGSVVAKGNYGEGLHVVETDSVTIGSYLGEGNATTAAVSECVFEGNLRCEIGSIISKGCAQATAISFRAGDNGETIHIGSIRVIDCAAVAVQPYSGHTEIDTLEVTDTQSPATLTKGLNIVAGGTNTGRVGFVRTNLAYLATRFPVIIDPSLTGWQIGPIQVGDGDPLEGMVTLSAGVSTAVANTNVSMLTLTGPVYFHPVIALTPVNAAARYMASAQVGYSVNSGSSGFSLRHGTALGTEVYHWRLTGFTLSATAWDATASKELLYRASTAILEQSDGATAQALYIYGDTFGSKRVQVGHDGTNSYIVSNVGPMIVRSQAGTSLYLQSGSTAGYYVEATSGDLIPVADATHDIGQAANRVRDLYLSRNPILTGLATYADEAAAASLATGTVYKTAGGELRIKL